MSKDSDYRFKTQNQYTGKLQVYVNNEKDNTPIANAIIRIYRMNELNILIDEIYTNNSGQSPVLELSAPPLSYSMEPMDILPYEPYMLQISSPNNMTVEIYGTQIFPNVTAIQPVQLPSIQDTIMIKKIIIGNHTLNEYYSPPVLNEIEKQIIRTDELLEIPNHVIIHTSVPSDDVAINLCTGYRDYIKNVVANEIYPTWPIETIYANIIATLSFTLNRIYTRYYKKLGYTFDVTSTNAFDNKWIYGRNYYDNISIIVDNIFNFYLSKPGIKQPILTPYCNGKLVLCQNMMEKWISKDLGFQGYKAIEILRYFYGNSLFMNETHNISNLQYPYPGTDLTLDSSGDNVLIIQQYLNKISSIYSDIPSIEENGIYSQQTVNAILKYQDIFFLPATGIVDIGTWYSIMMFFNKFNSTIIEC